MESTTIEQDRQEIMLPDGTKKYRIRTAVVEKGELPQVQIFVFEIGDPNDIVTDTFIQVGSPYDLETYKTDRALAVTAGDTHYLAGEFTRDFDGLEIAKQAKDAIYSRIDSLTRTWYDYLNDFRGVDDLSSHPSVSPEFEQQLIDSYADAKAARVQADSDLEDATEDVTQAEADVVTAQATVDVRKEETEFCTVAKDGYWTTFSADSDTFETASKTFFDGMIASYNAWMTAAGDPNQWPDPPSTTGGSTTIRLAMYNAMDAYDPTFIAYKSSKSVNAAGLTSEFNTFCPNASTAYAAAVNDKVAKDNLVAEAVTAETVAEADLAAAQAAEAAALAAVVAVCPDFDPTSV
jgi:hypothetical protein